MKKDQKKSKAAELRKPVAVEKKGGPVSKGKGGGIPLKAVEHLVTQARREGFAQGMQQARAGANRPPMPPPTRTGPVPPPQMRRPTPMPPARPMPPQMGRGAGPQIPPALLAMLQRGGR
jgi:hypothetical protein